MKQYNRVCARINLDAIAYNMEQMKNRIGQEGRLIAVIKTDAYGHGAVMLAPTILASGIDMLGVASIDEGVDLREGRIRNRSSLPPIS